MWTRINTWLSALKGAFVLCGMFLLFGTQIAFAQFDTKAYEHAGVSISLLDLSTGEDLVSQNAEQSLVPASTLKLITAATALELLKPDYQFKTKLAYSGVIEKGILNGNLILVGGGDPTLGSRYFNDDVFEVFNAWISAIKQKGITEIRGDLVLDASYFYPEAIPSRWLWEDLGNYYGAGVYALSCFDNYYILSFNSAKLGQTARIYSVEPKIEDLTFSVEATGSFNNSDSAYIFGGPNEWHKIVRGTIPANRMDFSIKGAIPNPPQVVAKTLLKLLAENSISVSGRIKVSPDAVSFNEILLETSSPKLNEILKILNFKSNNLFAEHLLRSLKPKGDIASAIRTLKAFWEKQSISCSSCFLYDGSGLSPSNAVSAAFMTQALNYMYNTSAYAKEFMQTIPIAGKEGTVKGFMKNAEGLTIWAKSGSMDNVRCYAGYIKKNQRMFAFSIMLNNFTCTQKEATNDIEVYLKTVLQKL